MTRLTRHSRATHLLLAATILSAAVALPAAAAEPSAEAPAGSGAVITGIDVSHWQGRIRWGRVARAGIDFAIAKATEGRNFIDSQYARNRERAHARGVSFTAYHFARPSRGRGDAVREADHFIRVARLRRGDLIPALDLERAGGLGPRALRQWVWDWMQRVRTQLGVKPMIYTTASFWRTYLRNTTMFADAGYRVLWIAHWGTTRPAVPAQFWDGAGWTLWQYTDCGRVDGIRGCVDRNRFLGASLGKIRL